MSTRQFRTIFCYSFFSLLIITSSYCQSSNIQDAEIKETLIKIAGRIYERQLVSGTGGDISVRVPETERMIIKATGNCLGDLNYDKLVTMNLNGEIVAGNSQPSHEAEIHYKIYSMRKNVGAIMHMHAPYATAWATVGKVIPAVTQQSVRVLKDVALVPYNRVGSKELVENVLNAYHNSDTQVVMMENHGVFIVGSDLYDLLYKAEVVENTARIAYFAHALGQTVEFEF